MELAASKGVNVVLALDALHRRAQLDGALESAFRETVYEPVLASLRSLLGSSPSPESDGYGPQLHPLAVRYGLGTYFTTEALGALGMAEAMATWEAQALETTSLALLRGVAMKG